MTRIVVPVFAGLGALGVAGSLMLPGTFGALHGAHTVLLLTAIATCGVCSLVFLKTRHRAWDEIARAAAEVAIALGGAVLVAGSLWTKATLDAWWTWDEQLTISLFVWLSLLGYAIVRRLAGATADRLASALAVFATAGMPFIYVMIGASDRAASASTDFATLVEREPLAFSVAIGALACWCVALIAIRAAILRSERELEDLRERAVDAGRLDPDQ